jgi:hypothetical protein
MRPFAQVPLMASFPKEANLVIDAFGGATIVGVLLPAVHFYVEVSDVGKLEDYVKHCQAKMPTLHYIASDKRLPRADEESGTRRWRMSIHLDDE